MIKVPTSRTMEDQIILQLAPNDCEGDNPADSLQPAMNYSKMILQPAQNDCEGDEPAENLQPALNYTNLTNDICRLVEQANEWSSTLSFLKVLIILTLVLL
jgi:hypothetical protein